MNPEEILSKVNIRPVILPDEEGAPEGAPSVVRQVGKWVLSTDEEHWSFHDVWDSEEEAVRDAEGYLGLMLGQRFFVGRIEEVDLSKVIDPESILEGAAETVFEEVGEVSEKWLTNVPKEKVAQLGGFLSHTFRTWLSVNGFLPTFRKVTDVRQYRVPGSGTTQTNARYEIT